MVELYVQFGQFQPFVRNSLYLPGEDFQESIYILLYCTMRKWMKTLFYQRQTGDVSIYGERIVGVVYHKSGFGAVRFF